MGTKACVESTSLAFVFGCVESPSLAFVFEFAVNGFAWVLVGQKIELFVNWSSPLSVRASPVAKEDMWSLSALAAGVIEEESRAFPLSAAFPLPVRGACRVAFLHMRHSRLAIHV